jgi:predicted HTH domain antitoxin
MAASRTSRNDTPNTPGVDESKIARMKVDDLRRELKARGVKGTADLKKPELVKKMIKAATSSASGRKSASASASGKKSASASARKSTSASKNPTSRNDTPNTPGVDESKIARMKADDLRRELKARGVKGTADLKKPELVKRYIAAETSGSRSGSAAPRPAKTGSSAAKGGTSAKTAKGGTSAKAAKGGKSATKGDGGKRTGRNTSSSLRYAQEIKSPSDRPERAGRSLVTTDHEVIRRWAAARKAVPATVEGTDHDGHLGVLRLDFPGYSGDRLTEVSWDDWFEAFDKRRLNFIFQEKQSGGKRSNFFQLENPDE